MRMASSDKVPELSAVQAVDESPIAQEKLETDASSRPDPAASEKVEETVKPEEKSKGSFKDYRRIFHYASTLDRLLYAVGILGAIISGATLPLMTIVFGSSTSSFNDYAVGEGGSGQFQNNVNHLVLYFVYLFIGRFVIGYVSTLCMCVAAAGTTSALRKAFLESLLCQDISYFDIQGLGSVATQVTTNGHKINQGIAEKLYTLVYGVSLLISAYVVAIAIYWKLALIVMTIVPTIFLVMGGIIAVVIPIEARVDELYADAATLAQDALGSMKTVHAFGAQEKLINQYEQFLQAAHKEGNKKSLAFGVLFSTQTFLVMCGTALAFWEGFRMYQSGEIANVGTVFTVVLSVTLGATSILFIMPQIQSITTAIAAAASLFSIMDKPSLIDPLSVDGKIPAICVGSIEIQNLSFAYPTRPTAPVLQDFSLSLPAGKTTALVGPSGCGKSTLIGLLERWYSSSSGTILLDGLDIAQYNTSWLRSNIRLVQQEPTLFQGTVFQNVARGLVGSQLELPEEKQLQLVKEACMAADCHDFVSGFPQGYNTQLGEGASMLSGGQRQRISIARSIISDPKILLFDEATSALDPRAEKVVQDALNRVSRNKTTLIIAHKLATVIQADNIAVMAKGKIVEQGSYRELLERDGLFAAMVRSQNLNVEGNGGKVFEQASDNSEEITDVVDLALQSNESRHPPQSTAEPEAHDFPTGDEYSLATSIVVMLKENTKLYPWYCLMGIAYLLVGGTYPAQAVIFSGLVRVFTLQGSEAKQQANIYSLMFFVVALVNLLGYFIIGVTTNIIGQTLTHRYRREMMEQIFHFDQDFHDRPENSSGAIAAKLSSAPAAVQELMSANLGLILNVTLNIVSSSILAIAYGWKLGLVMVVAGFPLIVGGGYIRIRIDQLLEGATEDQFASSASLAAEAVTSIRTISSLTLERHVLREYSKILDGIVAGVCRNFVFTLLPYALSQSADFLVEALGFWYGSRLIAGGEYTTTQFFIIFIAVVFSGQGAAQLFAYTTSITKAKGSANYILWLRTVKARIRETEENKGKAPTEDDASIGFESVEFHYKQRATSKVLRDISLNIRPGTYSAFVGPSGCGKSTIVSLLCRFYDPSAGRITFNTDDISLMSPPAYRRHLSLVQQEPPLYLGSVRDNIAIGLTYTPTDEEVNAACQQANALDFISSLPEGLNTPCGSKGLQFSGGQRQRIAVARALIRNPRLLLLDEATSALDTLSERIVQKALDEAAATKTTIAVAHRLSTIRHADVIFVIEDGRIVEMGTHEELWKKRRRYYAMCLAQSLDQA